MYYFWFNAPISYEYDILDDHISIYLCHTLTIKQDLNHFVNLRFNFGRGNGLTIFKNRFSPDKALNYSKKDGTVIDVLSIMFGVLHVHDVNSPLLLSQMDF